LRRDWLTLIFSFGLVRKKAMKLKTKQGSYPESAKTKCEQGSWRPCKWRLLTVLALSLALMFGPTESHAGLALFRHIVGKVVLSADAVGNNVGSGTVQIVKPSSGATVREAHLFAATRGESQYVPQNGEVTLNGVEVNWDAIVPSGASAARAYNARSAVTPIVKPVGDAAGAGTVTFTITEDPTGEYDGCILEVIWDDGTSTENSIMIFFGAQSSAGDTLVMNFSPALSANAFLSPLEFSLGIAFSHQPTDDPPQYSRVDVNGTRLTTSAGGEDDGVFNSDGALITVGGTGDTPNNPPPFEEALTASDPDDELYDLRPFASVGQTSMSIFTHNPSGDDNIFVASAFFRNVTVIIPTRLATVSVPEPNGWTFYPFFNGGGSQNYTTTTLAIDTSGVQNPAPQAVYQKMASELAPLSWTVNNLLPNASYTVRVHLCSVHPNPSGGSGGPPPFPTETETVWVSGGGSPNSVPNVNPYASGVFNRAMVVTLPPISSNGSGQLWGGMTPTISGNHAIANGVEIIKTP
jgi:hypothetical protein